MKLIKKTICLALCLALMIPVFNTANAQVYYTESESAEFLSKLGVMQMPQNLEAKVTRGGFAKLVIDMMGMDTVAKYSGEPIFLDVGKSNENYDAVSTLCKLGVISESPVGLYYPDELITGEQATKLIIAAMGYSEVASSYGGYPSGYMVLAAKMEMPVKQGQSITYSDAADMICSVLDDEVLETYSFVNGAVSKRSSDEPMLYVYHDIYTAEGVITDNGITSLYGETSIDQNQIMIEETVYDCTDGYVDKLGSNVYAYIRETSLAYDELVVIGDYSSNELIINAQQLPEVVDGEIEYLAEDGDTDTAKITTGFDYIYNYHAESIQSLEDAIPDSGYMKLVDKDGNKSYDVIMTYEYEVILAQIIDTDNGIIYDRKHNKTLTLDDDATFFVIKDGKQAAFADIGIDSLLSVFRSKDGKYAYVYISEDVQEATITSMYNDGTNNIAEINGKEYIVADSINMELKPGYHANFYFDMDGRIVYTDTAFGYGTKYGFVLGAGKEGSLDRTAKVRMYTSNGFFEIMELADKVTIDGKVTSDKDYVLTCLKTNADGTVEDEVINRPVRYESNGKNEITLIDTECIIADNDEDTFNNYYAKASTAYRTDGMFAGSFVIGSETVVLSIPDDVSKEDRFEVKTYQHYVKDTRYTVAAYDVNSAGFCKLILDYGSGESNRVLLVNKVSRVLSEEETVTKVSGYADGEETSFTLYEGIDESGLTPGSVISFKSNSRGEITELESIYTNGDDLEIYAASGLGSQNFHGIGRVLAEEDSIVKIDFDKYKYSFNLNNKDVFYKFNKDTNKVEKATLGEIRTYEDHEDEATIALVVCTNYARVKMIVILN